MRPADLCLAVQVLAMDLQAGLPLAVHFPVLRIPVLRILALHILALRILVTIRPARLPVEVCRPATFHLAHHRRATGRLVVHPAAATDLPAELHPATAHPVSNRHLLVVVMAVASVRPAVARPVGARPLAVQEPAVQELAVQEAIPTPMRHPPPWPVSREVGRPPKR
ncbi:MAG TPA: hypothetical protein VJN18_29165 [Polyangiaceae bacterium]|nr:hypothetical protein [Polyangiaceae bacterium]